MPRNVMLGAVQGFRRVQIKLATVKRIVAQSSIESNVHALDEEANYQAREFERKRHIKSRHRISELHELRESKALVLKQFCTTIGFVFLFLSQVTFDATKWNAAEPFRALATLVVPGQQDSVIDISASVCPQKLRLLDGGTAPGEQGNIVIRI